MPMYFDAHSDIWTDVTQHTAKGETDIFRSRHMERLKKGQIEGGIFVIWNDPPYDTDPRKRTLEMMDAIRKEEKAAAGILKVARSYCDMEEAKAQGKFYAFIGLEGLKSIGEDLDLIDEYYQFGARHAGLTWNEANPLATGALGDPDRGLTAVGKKAVRKIQDKGMLLDVSHLNDKSFWDLISQATGPVVATHSNCRALCNQARNLPDDQIKALRETGGIIGLNSFNEFVHPDEKKQDVEHLVKHLVHLVELMDTDHVGFGFDFAEFLEGDTLTSFSSQNTPYTIGLEDASQVPNLVAEMKRVGFSQEEIEKISCTNWKNMIQTVVG